jgi:hypothetical protein
MGLHVGAWGLI